MMDLFIIQSPSFFLYVCDLTTIMGEKYEKKKEHPESDSNEKKSLREKKFFFKEPIMKR